MVGSDGAFSCDIVQQTRFQYVVPVLVMLGVVVSGVVLGWVAIKLGAPPNARGGIGAASFLIGIGVAIYYFVGSQGSVRLDDEALVVAPRWRSEIRIVLPPVDASYQRWVEVHRGVTMVAGPMLEVEGRGASVVLGAMDVPAGERLPGQEGLHWVKTPNFVIEPADLRRIGEGLGVAWPGP